MNSFKIGAYEGLCILLILTISHILLNVPKIILDEMGSASALNIIYVTILTIIIVAILIRLYKNFPGKDILDVSQYLFGSFFKKIIGLLFVAYIIFISSNLLRNLSENLKIIYFQDVSITNIIFIFLICISFINMLNPKTVIKCNAIIVPLISIVVVILFIANSDNYVYQRLFPVLGYGAKETFLYGSSNIFIFGNIVFLHFLMPLLKNIKSFNKLAFSSILISSFFIFISTVSLLLMFPFVLSTQGSMPIYLQSRQISLGRFVQRTDAFFLLIWIISLLSYLSIALHFIINIFKKVTNIQDSRQTVYCFSALIFAIALLPQNVISLNFLTGPVYKNLNLILIFGISILILILANIKMKRNKSTLSRGEY